MALLCPILRKIILDEYNYCCLCFQMIGKNFYSLHDEVIIDAENSKNMHEIFSTVLGDQILDCISTNFVCRKCTETALNSFKFIKMCKTNVQYLASNITYLQKYTNHIIHDKKCDKSLFLVVEPDNRDVYKNDYVPKNEEVVQSVQLSDIINLTKENKANNYKCENCEKVYSSTLKVKHHYFRVHAPKNFKCSKCPRSFGSLLLLNRHLKDSHCTVVCSHCGKVYNNTYSLRHHERSHNIKLICQTCGKIYKGKQAFNNHIEQKLCQKMRKSNAEAKFTCSYCDKKYSQKAGLSVHVRLEHENGKALICDWCGKKLSSISRLKDHIIKHTKQKNFSCDACGGKFVTKVSLLYHTRTHTGEKPYSCDFCDMRFLSASRRSEHVKQHHMGPDLECDICHGKFKGRTCLMRHRKRHFNTSSRLYKSLESSANLL